MDTEGEGPSDYRGQHRQHPLGSTPLARTVHAPSFLGGRLMRWSGRPALHDLTLVPPRDPYPPPRPAPRAPCLPTRTIPSPVCLAPCPSPSPVPLPRPAPCPAPHPVSFPVPCSSPRSPRFTPDSPRAPHRASPHLAHPAPSRTLCSLPCAPVPLPTASRVRARGTSTRRGGHVRRGGGSRRGPWTRSSRSTPWGVPSVRSHQE